MFGKSGEYSEYGEDEINVTPGQDMTQVQLPPFDYVHPSEGEKELKSKWTLLRKKGDTGANGCGKHGGFYRIKLDELDETKTIDVFLKQDPRQEKNISEYFASQFMRFVAKEIGEDPGSIANVSFVETNNGVYVASEMFEGYRDSYLDAHLAYSLPENEDLRVQAPNWEEIPIKRPGYLSHDVAIDIMIKTDRYREISLGMALRAIVDDPDLHYENIGAVPITPTGKGDMIPLINRLGGYTGDVLTTELIEGKETESQLVNINGKQYYRTSYNQTDYEELKKSWRIREYCVVVHDKNDFKKFHHYVVPAVGNARAAHIDFGGALGDFRRYFSRKFDGVIHINDGLMEFLRLRPSKKGPPAYHKQLPTELRNNHPFFNVLAGFSMIEDKKIDFEIDRIINEAVEVYKDQNIGIFIDFAKRIGVEKIDDHKKDIYTIADAIAKHLKTNMKTRKQSAIQHYNRHFCCMSRKEHQQIRDFVKEKDDVTNPHNDILRQFYTSTDFKLMKPFDGIEAISFSQPKVEGAEKALNDLKETLHARLCQAYLKGNFEEEVSAVANIVNGTQELINHFENATSSLEDEKVLKVANFIEQVNDFHQKHINTSTKRKFAFAASVFAGTLLGALIGGLLGAAAGVVVGATVGSIVPVAGTIAGAASTGSIFSVVGALKGAGIGTLIATTAACYLFGSEPGYDSKIAKHMLFTKTDKALDNLTRELVQQSRKKDDENLQDGEFKSSGVIPGAE